MSLAVALAIAVLAASPAPTKKDALAAARAALEKGDYEAVLDAVNGAQGASAAESADVLSRAGRLALEKKDRGLAALYCEMAMKRAPSGRAGFDLCIEIAVLEERWEDVDAWGEALSKLAPNDGEVALVRAQAALAEAEWARAAALLRPQAKGPLATKARPLLEQAEQHLAEEKAAEKQQKELDARLKKALAQARLLDGRGGGAEPSPSGRAGVILYTTSWCGSCKAAKEWLAQKNIAYVERDVEKDEGATEELAQKCAQARVRPGSVPVLDARGKLLVGFNPASYARALR